MERNLNLRSKFCWFFCHFQVVFWGPWDENKKSKANVTQFFAIVLIEKKRDASAIYEFFKETGRKIETEGIECWTRLLFYDPLETLKK